MTTKRYMTPLKYVDGNGKEISTKVYFEIDPIELTDWLFTHQFEANELRASLIELQELEKQDSRNLTPDEVGTLLSVIKLLADISAGRPTDDGAYFIKDPNWTSSYAYRAFREFLLTNPNETQEFLATLLNNDVMEKFTEAMLKTNETAAAEAANAEVIQEAIKSDSGPETIAAMEAKIAELKAKAAAEAADQS